MASSAKSPASSTATRTRPTEVYVRRANREGLARRVLAEAFARARDLGCEEAWVRAKPDNAAAVEL